MYDVWSEPSMTIESPSDRKCGEFVSTVAVMLSLVSDNILTVGVIDASASGSKPVTIGALVWKGCTLFVGLVFAETNALKVPLSVSCSIIILFEKESVLVISFVSEATIGI